MSRMSRTVLLRASLRTIAQATARGFLFWGLQPHQVETLGTGSAGGARTLCYLCSGVFSGYGRIKIYTGILATW